MPKIPTFESQGRPTAEVGGVKTNIQLPFETSFTKMGSVIADYYVKEKTAEADTNALKTLSSLYGNQNDGTQGLYSIQDELKKNPNPSQAAVLYDQKIKQLWSSTENSTLANADNFTRKALEQKFYATANIFKQDVIKGSRDSLFEEQKKITSQFLQQDSLNLKTLGENYLPIFNQNQYEYINKLSDLEPQQKKQLIAEAIAFGHKELGQTIIDKSPELFSKLVREGKLSLDNKSFAELVDKANKKTEENTFNTLSEGLNVEAGVSTPLAIQNAYNQAKAGTFGGDVNKINMFNNLQPGEKTKFFETLDKKKRESFAEINNVNTAIMNERRNVAINNSVRVYDTFKTNGVIDKLKVNQIFGENTDDVNVATKQQFIDLSTKQGNNELKKISNYYKNNEITNKILNSEIKDISTPFVLSGENESRSILQRAGDGINTEVDLQFYITYLFPNTKNQEFVKDNKEFFKFIEKNQKAIEGTEYAKYLDSNLDNRLNLFKSDMLSQFISKRQSGISAQELLDPKSKNYIGKSITNYIPTKAQIQDSLSDSLKLEPTKKYPPKLPSETSADYLKRIGM
jgi:hypothetical protein